MKKALLLTVLFVLILSMFSTSALCGGSEKRLTIGDFLTIDPKDNIEQIMIHTLKDDRIVNVKISDKEKIRQFVGSFYNFELAEKKEMETDGRSGWYIEFYGKELKMNNFCYLSNTGIDKYSLFMSRRPALKYSIVNYEKLEAMIKNYVRENPEPRVVYDGENMKFNKPIDIKDGHTLVPLRELVEHIGWKVTWEEPKVIISEADVKDSTAKPSKIEFKIGEKTVGGTNGIKECPRAPEIINGVTFVPLRFLCELLGKKVEFLQKDGESIINITTPGLASNSKFDFAVSLMNNLPKDKNYMFSPLSIKMAFAMAANGASGETQSEILKVFGIGDLQKYNKDTKALIEAFNKDGNVKFNIANSIWLNKDYYKQGSVRFKDTFKKTVSDYYNGEAADVDKSNAVNTINSWISKNTENKINNVISNSDFLAALVNTIYFKGEWESPFYKEATRQEKFTDKSGTKSKADFMNKTASFNYYEDGDIKALAIPYKNQNISMYVVLPKIEQHLYNAGEFDKIIKNMKEERVQLSLPKFKVEFDIEMSKALKEMGIKTAFSSKADFCEMVENSPQNVFISEVIHKTYIDVNENGTEAAAATAVMMVGSAMPVGEPKEFNADHPFVYFIMDNQSGEVLFLGELGYVK